MLSDRYELSEVLGRGGMGTVYRAHDRSLDEQVALKVLAETAQGSPEADRRFRSEIKLARRIRHPNVCAIHEYGEVQDLQYIVMEFVTGEDLKRYLRARGSLDVGEVIEIVRQIGEGLQAIHDAGVVHRDLKPANVMRDKGGRLRLMDFGIAKGIGDTVSTATGQIVGTPEYMSPEQVQGQSVDRRADIYSLGIMTYELLTGQVPFKADTPLATIVLQVNEPPKLNHPAIPAMVAPVLGKALAKNPDARFESATAYTTALVVAGTTVARKDLGRPQLEPGGTMTMTAAPAAPGRGWTFSRTVLGGLLLGAVLVAWLSGVTSGPVGDRPGESAGAMTAPAPRENSSSVAQMETPPGQPAGVPPAAAMRESTATPQVGQAELVRERQVSPRPLPANPPKSVEPSPRAEDRASPVPPVAPLGYLQIGAVPYADVSVDGEDVGTLPLKSLTLAAGRHVVRFSHPDYQPLQRVVTIRQGETAKVFVDFSQDGILK